MDPDVKQAALEYARREHQKNVAGERLEEAQRDVDDFERTHPVMNSGEEEERRDLVNLRATRLNQYSLAKDILEVAEEELEKACRRAYGSEGNSG